MKLIKPILNLIKKLINKKKTTLYVGSSTIFKKSGENNEKVNL